MAASNVSTLGFLLKRKFARRLAIVADRDKPTWAVLDKRALFTGADFNYPIVTGNPQGLGSTIAIAREASSPPTGASFRALRRKRLGVVSIAGELIAASEGDDAAYMRESALTVSRGLAEFAASLSFDLFRDGTGRRCRRLSAASNVITTEGAYDALHVKKDMILIASANANGSSPKTGQCKVTRVISYNTFEVDNVANITSFANNDYLFRKGDPGSSSVMDGMQVCTPIVAPVPGDSFREKDRSENPILLAGARLDDPTMTTENAIGLIQTLHKLQSAPCTTGAMHPLRFYEISRREQARVQYTEVGSGTMRWGFQTFDVHTPGGVLRVINDPDCPIDEIRAWRPEAHHYRSLRDPTHVIMDDGNPSLRETDDDGIEVRTRAMGNYIQENTAAHWVARPAPYQP